jgi:hypothetical protein
MIPHDILMLPRNALAVDSVMKSLLPNSGTLQIRSEGKLYVHHSRRLDTGEELIHLINHEFPTKMTNAEIILKGKGSVDAVFSLSLDEKELAYPLTKLAFEMKNGVIVLSIKDIQHHKSLIVKWK